MKYTYTYCLILITWLAIGQNLTQLPTILPASPTASALMKYEEVPVSYYSGLPTIEIPLFNGKLQNGTEMPIKLSYHAANGKVKEIASDCGLGWSLIAGGSISRTVRGYPDEILKVEGSQSAGNIGIYQTTTPNNINRFYDFSSMVEDENINSMSDMVNEYLWDINIRGKYDTEHDIYQYNFMGYTGRFIIKKEGTALKVHKLDINPLQIINNYNASSFIPNSFTIFDGDGNRYLFDIIETTDTDQITTTSPRFVNGNSGLNPGYNYSYRSSFHLSKIYDNNNILLVELTYSDIANTEKARFSSTTQYIDIYGEIASYQQALGENATTGFDPLPNSQSTSTSNTTHTKKLLSIKIPGKEKISFNFSRGRTDSNLIDPVNSLKLNEITIENRNGGVEKKFSFNYGYYTDSETRLILTNVKEYGNSTAYLLHNLTYEPRAYYVQKPGQTLEPEFGDLDPSSTFGKVSGYYLSQMTLPTGGHIKYNFGPSTYSYIGNSPLSEIDFENNLDNWRFSISYSPRFTTRNPPKGYFFTIDERQKVKFHTANNFSENVTDYFFNIYGSTLLPNGTYQPNDISLRSIGGISGPGFSQNMAGEAILDPGVYFASFGTGSRQVAGQPWFLSAQLMAYTRKWKNFKPDGTREYVARYLYSSDVIIYSIEYFDGEKTKKEHFSYNFFAYPTRSSGSLVAPSPVYESLISKRECVTYNNGEIPLGSNSITYKAVTSTNQLSIAKTKGYGVGYQNVTVFTENDPESLIFSPYGSYTKKQYVYSSPIDYPEEIDPYLNLSYPYMPTLNIDYKRGLLLKEMHYNYDDFKTKEIEYEYSFEEDISTNGIRIFNSGNEAFVNYRNHRTYAAYRSYLASNFCTPFFNSTPNPNPRPCFCTSGLPSGFTQSLPLKEAFGWAKLDKIISREYFAFNNSIETQTEFEYKSFNQKMGAQKKIFADGSTSKTDYFYSGDYRIWDDNSAAILNSRNDVSTLVKTENYKNEEKISEQRIFFKDWGNGIIKPEIAKESKGNGELEAKFKYNAIDSKGNVLEIQREGGGKTCYIWGYDKTLPVAKIENSIPYASLNVQKITAIEQASGTNNYSEENLLNALNNLRSEPNLENAMITTYTYSHLSAISTITDPNGEMAKYIYDSFGNLESVRDKNGNILNENKYHYQNQF